MYCYAAKILFEREIEEPKVGGGHATIIYGFNLPSLAEYMDLILFLPYCYLMFMLLVLMLQ